MTAIRFVRRLIARLKRRELEAELAAELAFHLEQAEAQLVARGVDPDEARRLARAQTGGLRPAIELQREATELPLLDTAARLVRHAIRQLYRSPGLPVAAVLCIALGASASAAVTTLVSATILDAPPFPGADRMVRLWLAEPDVNPRGSLSIPDLHDFGSLTSIETFIGTARMRATALLDSGAHRLRGEGVTRGYFDALGLRIPLGRALAPPDHDPAGTPAVVLSHATWVTHFTASRDVIGRPLRLAGSTFTIVGVAPPGFSGTVEDDIVEFWVPLEHYQPVAFQQMRDVRPAWAVARLRPDTTIEQFRAEADARLAALAGQHPQLYQRRRVNVEPFGENWRGEMRRGALVLFGAGALLLLVAATNVGCLLTTRVIERGRQLALCASLGASRAQLAAQIFIETLLIVTAGGLLGAVLGGAVLSAFLTLSPIALPGYLDLSISRTALAISLGLLMVAALAAGAAPMALGRRASPADVLRDGGRGQVGVGRHGRWTAGLIAGETALTLVLLVGGVLLVRSYDRLDTVDLGFARENIVRLAVSLSPADVGSAGALRPVYDRIRQSLAAHPGVDGVAFVAPTLPPWDGERARFRIEGVDLPGAPDGLEAGIHLADSDLLPLLGVPIHAGRNIEPADETRDDRIAVVSRQVAELLGGPERAIGRTVVLASRGAATAARRGAFRVVGVAGDVAFDGLSEGDTRRFLSDESGRSPASGRYDIYLPLGQFPQTTVSIGVRTRGDAAASLGALVRRLGETVPASPVHWTSVMTDELALEYAPTRFYTLLVGAFSASALALTGVALFALLSSAAARRRPEMALRLALGSSRSSATFLVLRGALAPVAIGIAAGLLLTLAAGGRMAGIAHGVNGVDAVALLSAVVAFAGVALVAALRPAQRVATTAPAELLREG